MNFNGDIKFRTLGKGELQNAIMERLASAPTGESGRIYFNTTEKVYYYYGLGGSPLGPAWISFATGGDAASIQVELDATQLSMGYVNDDGTFDLTAFAAFGNISGSPIADLVDVLASMDAAITVNDLALTNLSAADVTFAPAGDIVATDVQAAIEELDAEKVSIAGDTMTGDLVLLSGVVVTLPDFPVDPTDAANKNYVDQLASNIRWRAPVEDADLIDIVTAEPTITGAFGDTVTYIKQGGTQGETWGGFGSPVVGAVTNVVDGDYLSFRILSTGSPVIGTWRRLGNLKDGDRFIIAADHGTIGPGLSGLGFINSDLIQYESTGSPDVWLQPEGAAGPGSPEIPNGTTVNVSNVLSYHAGHTYSYDDTNNDWVEIGGPASIVAGVGLSYDGNILNVNRGAGITELPADEIGIDLYDTTTGALILTSDGSTRTPTTDSGLYLLLSPTGFLSQDASGLSASLALDNLTDVTAVNSAGNIVVADGPGSPSTYTTRAIQFNYDSLLHGGASVTHTVTHNLNQQFVNVNVYKQVGSPVAYTEIIPQSVTLDSSSQLTVTFNAALDCVVVVSGVPGIGLA